MTATEDPVKGFRLFATKRNEYWLQWLPRRHWHFGHEKFWYDGFIHTFAVGPLEICWYSIP